MRAVEYRVGLTQIGVNLDDELLAAWAGHTPPPQPAITEHECLECDGIRKYFAGKPWTDFANVAELSHHRDALHLFAPSAYHYYLPAFIRATLLDPQTAGAIPDTIVFTIELEFGNASRGTLELFSRPQRTVLARFLRAIATLNLVEQENVATLAELLDGSVSSPVQPNSG